MTYKQSSDSGAGGLSANCLTNEAGTDIMSDECIFGCLLENYPQLKYCKQAGLNAVAFSGCFHGVGLVGGAKRNGGAAITASVIVFEGLFATYRMALQGTHPRS